MYCVVYDVCTRINEGVSVSSDRGVTWSHSKATSKTLTRYASMPSDQVWYLTAGIWAEDEASQADPSFEPLRSLSSQLSLGYDVQNGRYEVRMKKVPKNKKRRKSHDSHDSHHTNNVHHHHMKKDSARVVRKLLQSDAIWGEIWKTSDAGASWRMVYRNDGEYYFNAIDCCDIDTCYAVAEGDSDAGSSMPGTRILQTTDAGASWNVTYYNDLDGSSLMGVHCVSQMEAWAAGGAIVERGFHGDFLHTVDGGKHWQDMQVDSPVLFMDMTDDGTSGIASGLSKSSEGVIYGFF